MSSFKIGSFTAPFHHRRVLYHHTRHTHCSRRYSHHVVATARQFSRELESPGSPTMWRRITKTLLDNQVKSISGDQLLDEQSNGAVLIDIRPQKEFEKGFIEGSYNVPLYDLVQGWSFKKAAQRVGYAMFGVLDGTELNQSFFEEIEQVADRDQTVILLCGPGGNISPDIDSSRILPSRSLIAAHELAKQGYKLVKVLRDGVQGWENEDRDMLMMEE